MGETYDPNKNADINNLPELDPTREEYLTVAEVAKILRCCTAEVYRLMQRGTLPWRKVPGYRRRLIARSDVRAILGPGIPRPKPLPVPTRAERTASRRLADKILEEVWGK